MRRCLAGLALVALAATGAAHAEVTAKAPDGFAVHIAAVMKLDRDDAWARLVDIASWWSSDHTYSGDAASLSLDAKAGG
ncbi:MAG: ATPase, partial [Hyphomonadaceae bacterium]